MTDGEEARLNVVEEGKTPEEIEAASQPGTSSVAVP